MGVLRTCHPSPPVQVSSVGQGEECIQCIYSTASPGYFVGNVLEDHQIPIPMADLHDKIT